MEQVWIGFERDPGLVPWLIRKATRFQYNHVLYIYKSADWDREWTLESVKSGVRSVPLKSDRTIHERHRIKFDIAQDLREAQELIQQPYDLLGLILFGLWYLVKEIFRVRLSFKGLSLKGQLCSELIAIPLKNRFYLEMGNSQWVTPKDIWDLMKKRPEDFESEAT